jgi:hypothetical protein
MTLSTTAKISVGISAGLSNPQNLTSGIKKLAAEFAWSFTTGSGNDQIQEEWDDYRQLAASASENLDLAGSLLDVFGNKISFTAIKAILIIADSANTNDVLVGGAASNTFLFLGDPTDIVKVRPGGCALFIARNSGFTVTAATGDILKVANGGSGTPVSYKIYLAGTANLVAPS